MIWQYNPKKHQVWVPDVNLTIPCVKSLTMAKTIMDDSFDPTKWQCIVVSKSGTQLHNHPDRHSAELDALERCTKTAAFVVYENGKPVAAFINGKRLPDYKQIYWKNIYSECGHGKRTGENDPYANRELDDEELDWMSRRRGRDITAMEVAKYPWDAAVERTEDRIRFKKRELHLFLTKNGKHVSRIMSDSLTIHKDGRWFINRNGKIRRKDYKFWMPDEAVDAALPILEEFKPGISQFLQFDKWEKGNIALMATRFAKPNMFFVMDTYRGESEKRDSCIGLYGFWKYVPKGYTDESKLVPMLARKMGVPTSKQFKKLYLADVGNIQLVKNVMECGFTNPDNVISLPHLGMYIQRYHNRINTKDFIKKLISMKSESWVTKAFIKEGCENIGDMAEMCDRIEPIIADAIIGKATNLRQIHDTFVRRTSRQTNRRENRKIKYTDTEHERIERSYAIKNASGEERTIEFSLPEDTLTLAIIGMQMGLCVGGYDGKAVSRNCIIVQMKMGEEYIACIELAKDYTSDIFNKMVQLKAKCNNMVKAEYKPVIDRWLKDAEIIAETSDYKRIGEQWCSRYNYMAVNPADFRRDDEEEDRLGVVQVGPGEFDAEYELDRWPGEEKQRIAYKRRPQDWEEDFVVNEPFAVMRPAAARDLREDDMLPF